MHTDQERGKRVKTVTDIHQRLYHKEDMPRGSKEETGANGLMERYMHIQQQTKGNQEMGRGLTATGGEGRHFYSSQSRVKLG